MAWMGKKKLHNFATGWCGMAVDGCINGIDGIDPSFQEPHNRAASAHPASQSISRPMASSVAALGRRTSTAVDESDSRPIILSK